jgi:hypothetical protein
LLRRFWRAETAFFLGLWLFLMIGGRSRMFRDPGTFWHTAVGHRILSSRHFLDSDPFSFTFSGKPWTPYEWFGECLMAVLDDWGGLDTLLLATTTVLAGLYTGVAHRLIRSGLHWLPTVFLVSLTIGASAHHLHVRPHVVTIVFLGLTYGLLCDFDSGRIGVGRLFWLVPLFVVWSNIHGGALGGLATLVLAVAGWCLARFAGIGSPIVRFGQIPLLVLLVVASGLTVLVNPYGLRLPRVWLEIMQSPVVPQVIQEHAPLDLRSPDGWMVLLLGVIYTGALVSTRPMRPRVTWLLPLVWFYLALTRVRHTPLFSITAALALAEMLPYTRWAIWLARPGRDLFQFRSREDGAERQTGWGPVLLPFVMVLTAATLQAAGIRAPILGRGWVQLDSKHWPTELLPELRRIEREHPQTARIFNDILFGGFLIYYAPSLKVFIDDRCELYGDAWLLQYREAVQHAPGQIERWQKLYHFPYALVITRSSFDRYLSEAPDWTLVTKTDTATLYRRRERY